MCGPEPLASCCRSEIQLLVWSSRRLCCRLDGGMCSVQKGLQNPPSLMITSEIKLALLQGKQVATESRF